jgi:hypothetical protein
VLRDSVPLDVITELTPFGRKVPRSYRSIHELCQLVEPTYKRDPVVYMMVCIWMMNERQWKPTQTSKIHLCNILSLYSDVTNLTDSPADRYLFVELCKTARQHGVKLILFSWWQLYECLKSAYNTRSAFFADTICEFADIVDYQEHKHSLPLIDTVRRIMEFQLPPDRCFISTSDVEILLFSEQ